MAVTLETPVKCVVSHTSERIEVRGERSTKFVDGSLTPGGWRFFSSAETKLFDKIETFASGSTVRLTVAEMKLFAAAADRAAEAWQQAVNEQEEGTEFGKAEIPPQEPSRPNLPPPEPPKPPPEVNGAAKKVQERTIETTERKARRFAKASGQDQLEREVNGLQACVDLAREGYHMVIYDIPSKLDKECPNPSWLFWRYAFRLNKSCWVFTAKGLNAPAIQQQLEDWKQYESDVDGEGVEVHQIPYAASANSKIKRIAQRKLDNMIRQVHTSLITNIDNADKELRRLEALAVEAGKAWSHRERDLQERQRENKVRAEIKSAGKKLEAAIACAVAFDASMHVRDALNGLRQAIQSRDEALKAAVEFRKGV